MKSWQRNWTRMLLGVISAMVVCGTAAAQTRYAGRFTLPFEARWGSVLLPAGEYTFEVKSGTDKLTLISNARGGHLGFVLPIASDPSAKMRRTNCLLVAGKGSRAQVVAIQLATEGLVIEYRTPRSRESRKMEQAAVSEVPIMLATKVASGS